MAHKQAIFPDNMSSVTALVICVNYHNEADTVRFISSVLSQQWADGIKVLVVNNSDSMSPSVDLLKNLFHMSERVIQVTPGKNVGYFGGASFGLRFYNERYSLPEWIVVSNTDIEFLHEDFFTRLHTEHSTVPPAIIAPAIYSFLKNRNQNPYLHRRPSSIRMHFYSTCFRYSLFLNVYERLSSLKWKTCKMFKNKPAHSSSSGQSFSIYAPHGSFVIFNRKYFEEGGTLDHGVFLFGEEIFVAETARRLGLKIVYDPRLVVLHREHSTTKYSKERERHISDAAAYCANTFFR